MCQEIVGRSESETRPANWQPLDVVSTEVVYENGKEDYRNIMIDGKATKKKVEEVGAWSTGEFGTVLIDLFSPATATDFRLRGDSRIAGINAKQYTFEVARENSHWNVQMASQPYRPPYSGAVWIDPATSRVLRIEMSGKGFPDEFPADHVESATDYQYVQAGRNPAIPASRALRDAQLPARHGLLQQECHRLSELPQVRRRIDHQVRGSEVGCAAAVDGA